MKSAQKPNSKNEKPFLLTERHEEILREVYYYRHMRLLDITHLLYEEASRNYTGRVLTTLSGKNPKYPSLKYLYRFPLPDTRRGQPEYAYTLGVAGRSFLARKGYPINWYFRTSDYPQENQAFAEIDVSSWLKHDLTLTSIMVAAGKYFTKHQDVFTLREKRIDYDLRAEISRKEQEGVKTLDGQMFSARSEVVPDALLSFYKSGQLYTNVLLEVDRSSEFRTLFMKKIKALAQFIRPKGVYQTIFGGEYVIVAFVTTGQDERLKHMLDWTKQALEEIGMPKYAGSFFFRKIAFDEVYTKSLFLETEWYTAGEIKPAALLF